MTNTQQWHYRLKLSPSLIVQGCWNCSDFPSGYVSGHVHTTFSHVHVLWFLFLRQLVLDNADKKPAQTEVLFRRTQCRFIPKKKYIKEKKTQERGETEICDTQQGEKKEINTDNYIFI